jgi:hypothetical protein
MFTFSREFNIETHLAFINFEKAFDQIIHAIYNIYSNNKISIKTDSNPSKWEPINKGVRQGCSLSPLLFIIYLDAIIKRLRGGTTEEYQSTEV